MYLPQRDDNDPLQQSTRTSHVAAIDKFSRFSSSAPSSTPRIFLLAFCGICCLGIVAVCIIIGGFYGRKVLNAPEENSESLIIPTKAGLVQGFFDGDVVKFFGIPYGKAPTNESRWKPPQEAEKWDGVLSATEFGPYCPQIASPFMSLPGNMSEDCLSLNIWAPSYVRLAHDLTVLNLPVLVWIHGGGWTTGSGGYWVYDGTSLARKDHIVVTINYRLGPFGFLALPELQTEAGSENSTGNYGHYDMLLALTWVQKNIAQFGGNPQHITIFGESAGAMSILALMSTNKSRGLFQQAISESGNARFILSSLSDGFTQGRNIVSGTNCSQLSGTNLTQCLRGLPVDELLNLVPSSCFTFSPTVDGSFLHSTPDLAIHSSSFQSVPLVLGVNKDEGVDFIPSPPTAADYDMYVSGLTQVQFELPASEVSTLKSKYPLSAYPEDPYYWSVVDMVTDWGFKSPTRRFATLLSNRSAVPPVYLYEFRYVPITPKAYFNLSGVYHFAEVWYLWQPANLTFEPQEQAFANEFQDYFVTFSKTGNPNQASSATKWPAYKRSDDLNIVFNTQISVETGLGRVDQCNYFEQFYSNYTFPPCLPTPSGSG